MDFVLIHHVSLTPTPIVRHSSQAQHPFRELPPLAEQTQKAQIHLKGSVVAPKTGPKLQPGKASLL